MYLPNEKEWVKVSVPSKRTHLLYDKQIEEMTPKANYFDALVDKKLNTNIRDTAKELGVGEKAFVSFLIEKG